MYVHKLYPLCCVVYDIVLVLTRDHDVFNTIKSLLNPHVPPQAALPLVDQLMKDEVHLFCHHTNTADAILPSENIKIVKVRTTL